MVKIESFLHVAIVVKDVEISAKFYEGILGFEKVDRSLKYGGIWYQIGDIQIHLIEDPLRESGSSEFTDRDRRSAHFALGIDDLAGFAKSLVDRGCSLKHSSSGRSAFFVKDPDGNTIEFSQLSPNL
jgi:glyoxylase I family protein